MCRLKVEHLFDECWNIAVFGDLTMVRRSQLRSRSLPLALIVLVSIITYGPTFVARAPAPPLTVVITGTTTTKVGIVANFTATASGGTPPYTTYSWTAPGGNPSTQTGPKSYLNTTYSVKGTYTVGVAVTDSVGAVASAPPAAINIAALALSIVLTAASGIGSPPSAITLGTLYGVAASISGGTTPYATSWNFGDNTGNIAGGGTNPNVISHNYTSTGIFTVKFNATDANAVLASRSATIHVYPLSVLGIDCAYGSNAEGSPFPTSVPASAPYTGSDFDGTLDTNCQATYLADTDATVHPLVSDNPTAVVLPGAGGGITLDVVAALNPINTINGFDVSLKYDTKQLNAVAIDQSGLIWSGSSLPPGAILLTLAKTINNTGGTVRLAQVLIGAPQGPNSVELFRARFDIVGSGNKGVTLVNDVLTTPYSLPHVTQSLTKLNSSSIYDVLPTGGAGTTTLGFEDNWTFTPSPEVPGQPLNFSALPATCPGCTGPFTYNWDFSSNDAPTYTPKIGATGRSVTVTGSSPAIYRVTLTVTDSTAHSLTISRILPLVLVESQTTSMLSVGVAGPTGGITAKWLGGIVTSVTGYTGNWRFCPGSATVLTVCSSPAPVISQAPGSITQISTIASVTYHFAGLYNDSVSIRSAANTEQQLGFQVDTQVVSFLENVTGTPQAYTVAVSVQPSFPAQGQTANITASVIYDTLYPVGFQSRNFNYIFNFGDGTPAVTLAFGTKTAFVMHNFASAGSFQVRVVTQEASSNAISHIQENGFLIVRAPATPYCSTSGSCDFTPSALSVNAGGSLSFTATASGGTSPYTFSWSFGDGQTGSGATVSHTYQSAGNYNVTLTITDAIGETQTITKTVKVNAVGGPIFTSPLLLAGIAAAVILLLSVLALFMLRRRRLKPIKASPAIG